MRPQLERRQINMEILILGGTGAMGAHLCSLLAERGDKCVVTSRQMHINTPQITYLQGNARNNIWLSNILKQKYWDAIVDFMGYNTKEFEQRYKQILNSTKHYLFLSSARVYANSETPITENSPRLLDVCNDEEYLATDEYALTKARQEDTLKKSEYDNWTIIRPYVTYSEIRLQLSPAEKEYWLYGALHGKTIFFSKDIADKYTTLTYGRDVARGIVALIGKKDALREAFHITVSESHKWSEILNNYLDVIEEAKGKRPKVRMLEHWLPVIGGSVPQVKWDRLYDRRFDNSKINRFIDTTTFKPTLQTMSECLTEFMKKPQFRQINWEFEAIKDKITWEITNPIDLYKNHFLKKYIRIRLGI